MKIVLRTIDDEIIGQTTIPKFDRAPEIIIWGARVFDYAGPDDEISTDNSIAHLYIEAASIYIIISEVK